MKAEAIYGQNAPIIRNMQQVANKRLNENESQFVKETQLRKGYFKVLGWDKVKGQ